MTKRIVFIVEGDCEVTLINKIVIPYLYSKEAAIGWSFNVQKITTNRRCNAKGGIPSFEYLRNEILRVNAQGTPYITTFLDFFRLPSDFPSYTTECCRIDTIEESVKNVLFIPNLIPYIQKHEFETLLFSNVSAFDIILDSPKQLQQIADIVAQYPNIEDINGGPDSAPSKRLANIFPYNKTFHSSLLLELITIDDIMQHCPRFAAWIKKLEVLLHV